MLTKYTLSELDCADCAARMENHVKKIPSVRHVSVDFASLSMHIDTDDMTSVTNEIRKIEPEIILCEVKNGSIKSGFGRIKDIDVKHEIVVIASASLLFVIHLLFENRLNRTPYMTGEILVVLSAYLLAGKNVLINAARTIKTGRIFDENVLMVIATVGAFAIHAVSEATGVMIFFRIGELFQGISVNRSRRSIRALLEIRPKHANLLTKNGIVRTSPENIVPGNMFVVKAGEKIPVDGIVADGSSFVNVSAITGESTPVAANKGDSVLAGSINSAGMLTVTATRHYYESSIAQIMDLVENAAAKKASTEQFISRFALYYTPAVVVLALCTAFIPPFVLHDRTFSVWLYRALVLLVISCPCALVISVPLGYFGGIGAASRRGILIKGSNVLDALASLKTVVFDKTGTLTKGKFGINEIKAADGFTDNELLAYATLAESRSNHPIALSIVNEAAKRYISAPSDITRYEEIPGAGVKASCPSHEIIAGNDAIMHMEHVKHDTCLTGGTVVHVAVDGKYAGYMTAGDVLKNDSWEAIEKLRKNGIEKIGMLTGDNSNAAEEVAAELNLDFYHAGLFPEDKIRIFESLEVGSKKHGRTAFVGDGINDSPVIARADVGIAMGKLGSDAAIETADVVIMNDRPEGVAEAVIIGKKTRAIVWQNIVFALLVKTIFISLGTAGLAGMWEAVFADVGTAILAILNSTRALHFGNCATG
ncbi:MAG TPA: cadmium-translocating P-type ATPase [Fibrobacteres bacterium]|nr:cadmium-translocating P-type ATPase [Fibrobacterota bacterium]